MNNKCIEYDSRKHRRNLKLKGPRGTNWYKYYDGIPPSDDDNDYEWRFGEWQRIFEDD